MAPSADPLFANAAIHIVRREEIERPESWLSAAEREAAATFRFDRRRDEWILGRVAAKRLAIELGLCEEPGQCSIPTRGVRPELWIDGRISQMHLSLSHTGEVAAAAISVAAVGIDIQSRRAIASSSTRFFLRDDESVLLPERDETALLDLWSAKEAALKAAGVQRYRQVRLHDPAPHPLGVRFHFETRDLAGAVETRWYDDGALVLALAAGPARETA